MTPIDQQAGPAWTGPRPITWLVFVVFMALSATLALWFGRNVTFTQDELSIVSLVVDLEPAELFEPYVGHLVPIPFLAYKVMLEVVGTGQYAYYQAMTLLSIFLMGAGVLYWGCRRLPDAVALAPASVLILFTGDLLHYVAGNGFTIVFSLACGIWALNAWDRDTRWGDVGALLLLVIGLLTYTVGAAFAVGLVLAALIGNRRRLWVGGTPLVAYALWRILVASTSTELEDTGPDWANLLLLPAWAFQGVGGILEAMFGLGFSFDIPEPTGGNRFKGYLAPVLALGLIGLIVWGVGKRTIRKDFLVVASIAIALFSSQVLVWGSLGPRAEPLEPRYLYPGALVVILIGIEILRGIAWDRTGLKVLWLAATVAIISSAATLGQSVERVELATNLTRAQATGAYILQTVPEPPPLDNPARTNIRISFDPVATRGFPSFSFDETELDQVDPKYSRAVDLFLAGSLRLRLRPAKPGDETGPCAPALIRSTADGTTRAIIPKGGAILRSTQGVELRLGRFGRNASWDIGHLRPGESAELAIPLDSESRPWFVQVPEDSSGSLDDLVICQ